jgi:protocatechuate 3,4-dioxygenase beta subunit
VINLDGEPVRGEPVTIWQANTFGRYVHNDPNPTRLDPHFVGCVGIRSDEDGIYRIKTAKPGAYPAGPDWMRPPHIHFEVHGRFERLITQMYFPHEPLNTTDRLLNAALRPDLLVATCLSDPPGRRVLHFDIVLSRGWTFSIDKADTRR